MPATILDGKQLAQQIRSELAEEVIEFIQNNGVVPCLAAVLVGDDPASEVYVRNKRKACEEVGIESQLHRLPADVSAEDLLKLIAKLNKDDEVHGILVQLPLPPQIDTHRVLLAVSPAKDVDAFHPENVGRLVQGRPRFLPCTPQGVQQLLVRNGIEIAGRHVVIVGRSDIVGRPLAIMLVAARPGRRRDRDPLPQPHARSGRRHAAGRHPDRRHRPAEVRHRRHGQAGGRGGRRRHQPHRRGPGRRRRFRGRPRGGRGDHARARRRRPADHRDAAAQHAVGRRSRWKPRLQLVGSLMPRCQLLSARRECYPDGSWPFAAEHLFARSFELRTTAVRWRILSR